MSHAELKHIHNGGIVGQKYNMKRVCQSPWWEEEGRVGAGGLVMVVESWGVGARSVNPEQKEDLNHLLIRFWEEQSLLCSEYNCAAGSVGILLKWIYLQLCEPKQLSSQW